MGYMRERYERESHVYTHYYRLDSDLFVSLLKSSSVIIQWIRLIFDALDFGVESIFKDFQISQFGPGERGAPLLLPDVTINTAEL